MITFVRFHKISVSRVVNTELETSQSHDLTAALGDFKGRSGNAAAASFFPAANLRQKDFLVNTATSVHIVNMVISVCLHASVLYSNRSVRHRNCVIVADSSSRSSSTYYLFCNEFCRSLVAGASPLRNGREKYDEKIQLKMKALIQLQSHTAPSAPCARVRDSASPRKWMKNHISLTLLFTVAVGYRDLCSSRSIMRRQRICWRGYGPTARVGGKMNRFDQ
jgi:hypothetical protein